MGLMNECGGITRKEKGTEKHRLHSKIISCCLRQTQSSSLTIFSSCLVLLGADWQGFHTSSVWSVFCLDQVHRRHQEETREQNEDAVFISPVLSPQRHHRYAVSSPKGPSPSWGALSMFLQPLPPFAQLFWGPVIALVLTGPHLCKRFLYKTQSLSRSMPHGDPDWYKCQKENGGSLIRFRTGKAREWKVPTLLSLPFLYKSYLKGAL